MTARWRRERLGRQEALVARTGGALLAFGLGPPAPAGGPEARALKLRAAVDAARAVRWGRQVHGRLLASLAFEPDGEVPPVGCVGRCDGLLTAEPGLLVMVWTADCVPVLLAGGGVVAAVHAGWRGAAAGIVAAAVRRIEVEYGVPPARVSAWLGPSVGPCHYAVGPEVVAALERRGVDRHRWLFGSRVDLRAVLEGELERCGVPVARIARVGGCTACDPACASYRRDGAGAGRQPSLAVLLP